MKNRTERRQRWRHSSTWHTAGGADAEPLAWAKKIGFCYLFCHSWLWRRFALRTPLGYCKPYNLRRSGARACRFDCATEPRESWMMMTWSLLAAFVFFIGGAVFDNRPARPWPRACFNRGPALVVNKYLIRENFTTSKCFA